MSKIINSHYKHLSKCGHYIYVVNIFKMEYSVYCSYCKTSYITTSSQRMENIYDIRIVRLDNIPLTPSQFNKIIKYYKNLISATVYAFHCGFQAFLTKSYFKHKFMTTNYTASLYKFTLKTNSIIFVL